MAEQNSEILTPSEARPGETPQNAIDQIAGILGGIDEIQDVVKEPSEKKPPKAKPKKQDLEEELPQSEESIEEEEELEGEEVEEEEEPEESDEELSWAGVLGVDEKQIVLDEDGEFAGVNVKVDGKIDTVDLPTLIAGFQNNKSNTNKSKALAEERKQFVAEKQSVIGEYSAKVKDATALSQYLENNILKEYEGIDWNALRFSNPGEYAAMIQDYQLKVGEIQKIKDAINVVNVEETQKQQEQFVRQNQQFVQEQIQKVIDKNKEWQNPKVFKEALTSMAKFLNETYEFTQQEFEEVKDARIIELIKDAQAYRTGKKVADKKLKTPVPKFQKPVGRQQGTKTLSKLEKLKKVASSTTGYAQREAQRDAVAELLAGKID